MKRKDIKEISDKPRKEISTQVANRVWHPSETQVSNEVWHEVFELISQVRDPVFYQMKTTEDEYNASQK